MRFQNDLTGKLITFVLLEMFYMKTTNLSDRKQIELWSYVTLLKGNNSFWQHLSAEKSAYAWCLHDTWTSKSSSSLSNPSENLSKNLSKSGEIVKSMGSHRKLGKFESLSSYPKFPTPMAEKFTHRMIHVLLRSVAV